MQRSSFAETLREPRTETITKTYYKFSELSEQAQAKAIEKEQEYQGEA